MIGSGARDSKEWMYDPLLEDDKLLSKHELCILVGGQTEVSEVPEQEHEELMVQIEARSRDWYEKSGRDPEAWRANLLTKAEQAMRAAACQCMNRGLVSSS